MTSSTCDQPARQFCFTYNRERRRWGHGCLSKPEGISRPRFSYRSVGSCNDDQVQTSFSWRTGTRFPSNTDQRIEQSAYRRISLKCFVEFRCRPELSNLVVARACEKACLMFARRLQHLAH